MKIDSGTDSLRYPIGKFQRPAHLSTEERSAAIQSLSMMPQVLRDAIDGLYEAQLDTPYRHGGWTARQTIHHVADSHMQASSRMRLALTEDWPKITPYQEALWAELPDVLSEPVTTSLQLLEALHTRWASLLVALPEADWTQRGYNHPDLGNQTIEQIVALYAWHGRHHTAHITALRERMGW